MQYPRPPSVSMNQSADDNLGGLRNAIHEFQTTITKHIRECEPFIDPGTTISQSQNIGVWGGSLIMNVEVTFKKKKARNKQNNNE